MNKLIGALAFAALVAATPAVAHQGMHMGAKAASASKPATLRGEIVDTGCYVAEGMRGAKNKECTAKCVNTGMPMALLTADNRLYLLTPNHDNADPYEKCKGFAAEMVAVTGVVSERNGMRIIDVSDVKPVETAAK